MTELKNKIKINYMCINSVRLLACRSISGELNYVILTSMYHSSEYDRFCFNYFFS